MKTTFGLPLALARGLGEATCTVGGAGAPPGLPELRVLRLASRNHLRIDPWQRLARLTRLRFTLHNGADAIQPKPAPVLGTALDKAGFLTGRLDLLTRALRANAGRRPC